MGRLAAVLALLVLLPQDLDKRRDELSARLEKLRGLAFKSPVVLREGSRRGYAEYVLENAKRVYGADLTAAGKGLKVLGLIPAKLRLDVAITATAGFGVKVYASGGEVLLLDLQAGDEWILNKMDLALVDQHHPAPAAATFDAQMAWSALRMGDAEVVKHLIWTSGKITDETVKKVADEVAAWEKGDSRLASAVAPRLFVRGAEFPWRRGAVFALTQYVRGTLDAAYARPPASTEQVLHPAKYAEDEKPVTIDAAPVDEFLASKGYLPVYKNTLGELGVALLLETHFPREDLTSVSEGWGGDAFAVYEKGDAPPLVLWITEWDTQEDAIEFQAQAFRLMKRVLLPDSELTAPVLRRKTGVAFGVNVPKELQDGLLEAAWKGERSPARSY
ncbi:MAG TPA: hypothetical protein VE981_18010 [Planctomycetota bacterium]|nr:hypothetical protein [Planctomycetota bacterium]